MELKKVNWTTKIWELGLRSGTGNWGLDRVLELGIGVLFLDWGLELGIGDRDWGLELGIEIGDWDWGLGLEIGNWDWNFDLGLEIGIGD